MSSRRIALFVAVVFMSASSAFSMPEFLEAFRRDPFRRATVDGCQTCHMSAAGGDARNAFGQAFERGGTKITTLLRAQFPDRFNYPSVRAAAGTSVAVKTRVKFSNPWHPPKGY